MQQLQSSFTHRDQFAAYLHRSFPAATSRGSELSPIIGGREAAEKMLTQIDPEQYASTRNMLDGMVTHLSPYLRHGLITLAEVRHTILELYPNDQAQKLLQELAWRDYYQRVYDRIGDDVWKDIEAYKTGIEDYEPTLPTDISEGNTGLRCIDSIARELRETGYLHNHARMWTAAYIVHHRHIRWQAGASWFLQHLLDGDPASNNLSWQWIASTFAAKPYYFNQENLSHFTQNTYCQRCPLQQNGCPFAGTYDSVAKRIFGNQSISQPTQEDSALSARLAHTDNLKIDSPQPKISAQSVIVWLHEESLNPHNPAIVANPQAPVIFVFDEIALENAAWTLKRICFLYESLLEIPQIQIYSGSPVQVLSTLQKQLSQQFGTAFTVATTPAISPLLHQQMQEIEQIAPLYRYPLEPFAPIPTIQDLRRFSRYWKHAQQAVLGRAP